MEANFVGRRGFVGAGIGIWDFASDDAATGSVLAHFGVNLRPHDQHLPLVFLVEGRLFFDHGFDMPDNNYLAWAGLRVYQ